MFSSHFNKLSNIFPGSLYTVIAASVERFLQLRKPEHANKVLFLSWVDFCIEIEIIYSVEVTKKLTTVYNT